MNKRVVIPELLDHLPAEDPEAMRSRRDLRRINFFMGNERWICREIQRFPEAAGRGIVEIGAGEGGLCHRLARMFPEAPVSAYDLAPAPEFPGSRVVWHRGDLFEAPPPSGGVVVANLFVHHFEGESLAELGRWMRNSEVILLSEPDRCRLPHLLGGIMHPFMNRVTRHDMHVSIGAGFRAGELAGFLGLDRGGWRVRETSTWRGARRVIAWRS
ncbi:MAG: class I SAM-dependent methyltransferase [Verrucomicrobiota bacterium]